MCGYDVLLVWFQWSALVSILELKLPTNNIKDQDNDNIDIASTELYYYSILIAQRGSSLK